MAELRHTSWAPSKLGCYEECPAKAFYKYIRKFADPGGPALVRGNVVHENLEHYVANRVPTLKQVDGEAWNESTKQLADSLREEYKAGQIRTELSIGFTNKWKPCEWMAKDVWLRVKVDLVQLDFKKKSALVTDWKSGKFKPDGEYDDQLRIYCVALLDLLPDLKEVTAQLWFTDVGERVRRPNGTLKRSQLKAEHKRWEKKVAPMFADVVHAPTPGLGCRWCPYSVQKGGPCKF